jgi:hypothetical protein
LRVENIGDITVSQPITRIYATADDAAGAVKRLKFFAFPDDVITLIAPPGASGAKGGPADGSADKLTAAIMAAYVLKADARIYAAEVRQGHWLVSIRPALGMGVIATEALDGFRPVASQVREIADRAPLWDAAAPASSALGIPPLMDGAAPSTSLGIPTLAHNSAALSRALGLPLLLRPSPSRLNPELSHFSLSTKLGLPLLTNRSRTA